MSYQDTMEEKSVAQILDQHNLIVPEIQREYVWGFNEYEIITSFIEDIKSAYQNGEKSSGEDYDQLQALLAVYETANEDTKKVLTPTIEQLRQKAKGEDLNIGFLYSYRPNYILDNTSKEVFLIDGQQRFTTLFLFLFYFAIKESRKDEFMKLCRFDLKLEKVAFDYRVRNITHDFFIDLISHVDSIHDFSEVREKNWFLATYKNDTTVKAVVGEQGKENGTFPLLIKHFNNDSRQYFDFILNRIKFWHFKTEETSQGEELYITMNSRGQQLEDNENIRAKLFETDEAKADPIGWSTKWEEWQDFFWKHRDQKNSSSADKGFNEFLRWVVVLEMILNGEPVEDNEQNPALLGRLYRNIEDKLPIDFLSLTSIDRTMDALLVLKEFNSEFEKELSPIYDDYDHFDLIHNGMFLSRNTSLKQIELFKFLPALYYVRKQLVDKLEITHIDLFRVIRFFHNRSEDRNLAKSTDLVIGAGIKFVSALEESGDILSILENSEGISATLLSEEEKTKMNLIKSSNNRVNIEDVFWRAEDFKYNKGSISHLIETTNKVLGEDEQTDSYETFKKLFNVYEELIENEYKIWGDLVKKGLYHVQNNRIIRPATWYKNAPMMEFTLERMNEATIDLSSFLLNGRKGFIRSYTVVTTMKGELDLMNQLSIYYALTRYLGEEWKWDKWNFGVYESAEDAQYLSLNSLFDSGHIFERYNAQWRYNVGYQTSNGLWVQENAEDGRDYFQELINWANT